MTVLVQVYVLVHVLGRMLVHGWGRVLVHVLGRMLVHGWGRVLVHAWGRVLVHVRLKGRRRLGRCR
ncbi:hypothetical protein LDL08_40420 [Nonomuraea glycinis]|uniref:Uncharacterized protein n=1 Tax=Nonomuraea glycinis TaxID=2047744 RepID=A0A918AG54_9ACTN|nr:hypothetical protein [Nonomuraea glycinis]MCA2182443.1 hypothetical protein [Nonomuraea glycinis]GGP16198.1 hypothetical protein GCM10012278_79020 [Nonomuraea glycinis]